VRRLLHVFVAAFAAIALPSWALNPMVIVSNDGTGLFDVGRTFGQVMLIQSYDLHYGGRLKCDSITVERTGTNFNVGVTVEQPTEAASLCEFVQSISFGELPAGTYSMEATFATSGGVTIAQLSKTFEVKPRGAVCNVSPEHHLLDLFFDARNASQFVARYNSDADLRASLANITIRELREVTGHTLASAEFDPLADPHRVFVALRGSGEFSDVRYYTPSGCGFALCPGNATRKSIEYFNATLDQYFYADDPAEIALLDSVPSSGWIRTGESFDAIYFYGNQLPIEGQVQRVYRFWNSTASAKSAHFFTVSQEECAALRDGVKQGWQFEGSIFWAYVPQGGTCPIGTPLRRLYNNGMGGAPAHRFTTRQEVAAVMTAKGWLEEGIAMCVGDGVPHP